MSRYLIRHPDNQDAVFETDYFGLARLAKREWISGKIKQWFDVREQRWEWSLEKVKLSKGVPVAAARREANQISRSHGASITRIRTAPGAKHWKQCLDRADGGLVGQHKTLFVGRRTA